MDSTVFDSLKHKGITVYCGSSAYLADKYLDAARSLGRLIASAGIPLINGGGRGGMMGAVNDACLEAGGRAIGVIPRFMVERDWHHRNLSELHIVENMHERKNIMASLARGVIALPGGIGTFEEFFEIITWRQLGLYEGNIVVLNTAGYYDKMLAMLQHAIDENYMRQDHRKLFSVALTPEEALASAMAAPDQTITFSPKF